MFYCPLQECKLVEVTDDDDGKNMDLNTYFVISTGDLMMLMQLH